MTAGRRGGGSKVVDNESREEGRGEQGRVNKSKHAAIFMWVLM